MLADRRQPPPSLRRWNPAVSPAVEGIVRKCLAPDPATATSAPTTCERTCRGSSTTGRCGTPQTVLPASGSASGLAATPG